MKERFTDTAWTEGDFNKATTSPSQTALQNSIWFIKYHLSPHLNFKPERPSISFEAGKFVHEWFQQILVEEPSIDDSISILRGLKEKYEVHHGVKILDSAITSAVE